MSDPTSTVISFVAAINAHDLDAIVSLMSEDHVFVDAFGESWEGRSTMRRAWNATMTS